MMRSHLAAVLTAATFARPEPATAQSIDIVGSWRGTSICVDKVSFPACNNEVVIYDVKQKGTTRDTVHLAADKVVNGVRDPMGEFDFHRMADGSWVGGFENANTRLKIVLRVRGTHLSGVLTNEIVGKRVRDLSLDRLP